MENEEKKEEMSAKDIECLDKIIEKIVYINYY